MSGSTDRQLEISAQANARAACVMPEPKQTTDAWKNRMNAPERQDQA
jgi:hypothetical protein